MKQTKTSFKIKDLFKGYLDDPNSETIALNGKLCVRPDFQREFIYKLPQQEAVIDTILNDGYLGVFSFFKKDGDSKFDYDLGDGQQRGMSIFRYCDGKYPYKNRQGNDQFVFNLSKEDHEKLMNYEIDVIIIEGTKDEKLDWYRRINTAGITQTDQELLNATYSGPWCSKAKEYFTKRNGPADNLYNKYLGGSRERQDWLATAIKWVSKDATQNYMAQHQFDQNCDELWEYFDKAMKWFISIFPKYRKEMKGLEIGRLYESYGKNTYDSALLEKEISKLYLDDDVTKKAGVFEYLLSGKTLEKLLSIRAFTDSQKATVYERQKGICPKCGKHFSIEEMEGDHITPWHLGGKTTVENLQMLCKDCNRKKGGS